VGFFGRIYVNQPELGSRIEFDDHVWLNRHVEMQVTRGQKIRLARRVTIQDYCKITGDVTIGAYSTIAPNVFISSSSHQFSASPEDLIKTQDIEHPVVSRPVELGEDVWLGANVVVMPGVTIGRGSIVGANSVVTSNIEPYMIYAGAPAKPIKHRLKFAPPHKISSTNKSERIYFYKGFDHEVAFAEGMRMAHSTSTIVLANNPGAQNLVLRIFSRKKKNISLKISCDQIHTQNVIQEGWNDLNLHFGSMTQDRHLNFVFETDAYTESLYVRDAAFQ